MKFKGEVSPNWCPGCGDYGLLSSTIKALEKLGKEPHEVVIVSGIGCSSNFPHFTSAYGYHAVHGRALPAAMAIKLSNPNLTVIAVGGDGDGYGIGMGHFIHALRRNIDITYLVMNNQIYGLTLGQPSPTSTLNHITVTTPHGVDENPVNPISTALGAGATFVARGFSGNPKLLQELIIDGINHKGFSFIDVLSPCVTFNKLNTYNWFRERLVELKSPEHESSNLSLAFKRSLEWENNIPVGLFFKDKNSNYQALFNPLKSKLGFQHMNISAEEVFNIFR